MTHEITPLEPYHLAEVFDKADLRDVYPVDQQELLDSIKDQNSWALVIDGSPEAVGGTVEYWPGRSMGWAIYTDEARKHPRLMFKSARHGMKFVSGRLEASARTDWPQAQRFLEALGFTKGELLEKYDAVNADHYAYTYYNGAH